MDWVKVIVIIGSLGTLMLYLAKRIESNLVEIDNKIDSSRIRDGSILFRLDDISQEIAKILRERK